jgi:hypothetical protein
METSAKLMICHICRLTLGEMKLPKFGRDPNRRKDRQDKEKMEERKKRR